MYLWISALSGDSHRVLTKNPHLQTGLNYCGWRLHWCPWRLFYSENYLPKTLQTVLFTVLNESFPLTHIIHKFVYTPHWSEMNLKRLLWIWSMTRQVPNCERISEDQQALLLTALFEHWVFFNIQLDLFIIWSSQYDNDCKSYSAVTMLI